MERPWNGVQLQVAKLGNGVREKVEHNNRKEKKKELAAEIMDCGGQDERNEL